MSGILVPCGNCGRLYNRDVLKKCPGCAGREIDETISVAAPVRATHGESSNASPSYPEADLLKDLIRATNRTTYAVRALVSYIAILTITAFLAAFVYNFGIGFATSSGNFDILPWTTGLTYAIAIIGAIWALAQFLREWRLSRVR